MQIFKILITLIACISITYLTQSAEWKALPRFDETYAGANYHTINYVDFIDDSTGMVILTPGNARCAIKKTTDGGETWRLVFADTTSAFAYNAIQYFSENLCYISANRQRYIRSTDGGESWEIFDMDYDSTYVTRMTDDQYGMRFIYGYNSYTYEVFKYTTDGGESWNDIIIPEEYKKDSFWGADIIDEDLFIFRFKDSEEKNYFVRVENGMTSWTKYDCPESIYNHQVLDRYHCWAFGRDVTTENIERMIVYHSDDGCKSWQKVLDSAGGRLYDIVFNDNLNGMILGEKYIILRTADGGQTWERDTLEGYPVDDIYSSVVPQYTTFPTPRTGFCIEYDLFVSTLYKLSLEPNEVKEYIFEQSNNNLLVFPNPVPNGTELKIKTNIEINQAINISITDLMGNTRFEKNINNQQSNIITVSEKLELPPGCYFIRLNSGEQVLTEKLIVSE